jgi:type I restriction enzyme, S subunit
MEVKRGYKQTEVGVIPEDWGVHTIGSVVSISVGRDLREEHYSTHQTNRFRFPVFSNTIANCGTYGFYDFPEYMGDSLTIVGRGVGLGTAFKRSGGFGAIGRLLVLFPHKCADAAFLAEYINHRVTIFIESGGIPQLTGLSIAKYRVPLPPTTIEQESIAEALSDADALIEFLEQLITKKRQVKHGAMQELLTGKKRLPGFASSHEYKQTELGLIPLDWELDYVENVAYITTGSRNTQDNASDGQYPFFVRSQTIERINSYSFDGEAVLTAGDGVGTGKVFHYINGKFDTHQRVYRISNFADCLDGYFFYLYFSTHFYSRIMQMTAKSSVDSVRREMIAKMRVPLPSVKAEQIAIAEVLRDIEAEIDALGAKLAGVHRLKQGIMQELLTGRIRLI